MTEEKLISRSHLQKELKFYGVDMSTGDFNDLLAEMHHNLAPSWTSEQLLYHPYDALRFCAAIRSRSKDGLPDEMILRRLQNIRKQGLEDVSAAE
jgi:hypothetical protein